MIRPEAKETMKRSLNSDHSIGSNLKRHHNSMFSIATVMEDVEDPELKLCYSTEELRGDILDMGLSLAEERNSHLRQVSFTSATSAGVPTKNYLPSGADFFIEDESDEVPESLNPFKILINPSQHGAFMLVEIDQKVKEDVLPLVETNNQKVQGEEGDLKTGIIFEAAAQHFDRHNQLHKERPLRVTSICDALVKAGIQERCSLFDERQTNANTLATVSPDDDDAAPEMIFLKDEDFLRVHVSGYMQRLDKLSGCTCHDTLDREAGQFKSIFFAPDSVHLAKIAAASLCRLVTKVVKGDLDNGFAVIRPPGHHAEPGLAGGYCVVNNVAVAASYARTKLQGVKRVLIVDWDVHHGNGTQSIFLEDPSVLYFSVHRWHGGNFFPFLKNGGASTVGVGKGAGFNVNVGWSRKGMGDDEYEAVWAKVLMPIAREYQPDLVLVSAGFDAADGDMGECHTMPECFGMLTRSLKTLAGGKVVCSLEGGYVRSVLGECVKEVVMALLDGTSDSETVEEDANDSIFEEIDQSATKNIRDTIAAHQSYWKCFQQD